MTISHLGATGLCGVGDVVDTAATEAVTPTPVNNVDDDDDVASILMGALDVQVVIEYDGIWESNDGSENFNEPNESFLALPIGMLSF
ncbi:hypothetical protein ACLKA6_001470 [Drosophila palustris]